MCESPYTMRWDHTRDQCSLMSDSAVDSNVPIEEGLGNPVEILWGRHWDREWQSLAHVWSEWYDEYYNADFPRLMVRFEGECARPTVHCFSGMVLTPSRPPLSYD